MKQVDLARKLDISPSYLSEIEKGKKTISVDLLKQYAQIFDVPIETFLRFELDAIPNDPARVARGNRVLKFFEWVAQEDDDDEPFEEKSASKTGNAEKTVRVT
jgi:transcriptional regulator with XRE-family HTH domain